MRNLKKILALVLSLMMVLSVMVTASATDFADDADITNKEAVEVMSALGILSGSQGKFVPQGTLTRAEAAKIISFIKLGADAADLLKGTGSALFADVTSGWAYDYISYCANEGIISGYTVNGAKNFGPKGTLTGYQFGKMVLVAAGVEGTYTGSGWEVNVATTLKKANLLTGLETLVLSANITREQAAQLALNAMTHVPGGSTVYTVNGVEFDNLKDAAIYAALVDKPVVPSTSVAGSLANTVYGLSRDDTTTDAYGRAQNVWTATKVGTQPVVVKYVTETPVLTYDAPVTSADLYADLGLKADLAADSITVKVDNVAEGGTGNSYATFTVTEKGTALLGAEGQTIEVYKTGTDTYKAVLVSTVYASVASVNAAGDTVSVTGYEAFKATGYKANDKVLLTFAYNGSKKVINSMEKVETFTGTLTSYTKNNVFSINGKAYEASNITGADKTATLAAVKGFMGVEKAYGLDKAGRILYVTDPTGDAPVVPTNYAVVLDANVVVKTTAAVWPSTATTTTVTAQIQVLLSDGTVAVWDVPVAFTKSAITGVAANHYYVTVAGTKVDLGAYTDDSGTASSFKAALKTALDTVYTYANEALVSAVATLNTSNAVSGAYLYSTTGNVTKTTYAQGGVIFNNNTVFVLRDSSTGKVVVKTGLAALESTNVAVGSKVVVDVTSDGKTAADNVNVAKVVFATGTFSGAPVESTNNYVLVDGDYTTSVDAEGKPVYTYTYTKADGSAGTVAASKDLTTGIYVLKTDGTLNETDVVTTTKSDIGIVSGTTVYVGTTAMTTTAKTVVVGGELVKGAKAYVVSDVNNVISLAFIVE